MLGEVADLINVPRLVGYALNLPLEVCDHEELPKGEAPGNVDGLMIVDHEDRDQLEPLRLVRARQVL